MKSVLPLFQHHEVPVLWGKSSLEDNFMTEMMYSEEILPHFPVEFAAKACTACFAVNLACPAHTLQTGQNCIERSLCRLDKVCFLRVHCSGAIAIMDRAILENTGAKLKMSFEKEQKDGSCLRCDTNFLSFESSLRKSLPTIPSLQMPGNERSGRGDRRVMASALFWQDVNKGHGYFPHQ